MIRNESIYIKGFKKKERLLIAEKIGMHKISRSLIRSHMVVHLVQEETRFLLYMPSLFWCAWEIKTIFRKILQVKLGTGVSLQTDTVCLGIIWTWMLSHAIKYTAIFKTATTYPFLKLHVWKEFIPRLILYIYIFWIYILSLGARQREEEERDKEKTVQTGQKTHQENENNTYYYVWLMFVPNTRNDQQYYRCFH